MVVAGAVVGATGARTGAGVAWVVSMVKGVMAGTEVPGVGAISADGSELGVWVGSPPLPPPPPQATTPKKIKNMSKTNGKCFTFHLTCDLPYNN